MIAGFTVRFPDGSIKAHPPLVTVAQDDASQTTAILLGRLDYRDELGISPADRPPDTERGDAALALAVYLRDGVAGLQRLEGEFALVIRDARRRRLLGMRDPFGSWPLYWRARGGQLAIGTSLRALADDGGGRAVDLGYVAEFLARPFVPSEVPCTATAVPGVQRVLPGTLVELGPDGGAKHRRYWDWSSRIPVMQTRRVDEVADQFRELLRAAVRQRTRRGRIATHLSGGMDSSAVTVLAGRAVAESGAAAPVVTISLTYHAAELTGERRYMDLVLGQGGPLEPHFIPGDAAVGFDWFDRPVPPHDEPYVGLWSLAANRLLVDVARRCGAGTVLTGVGADEMLSYRPLHIADLLRRGRLLAGLREAAVWGEAHGLGVWSVLRQCGLEPLWPNGFHSCRGLLRRCRFRPRLCSGPFSMPPWIRPEFARRHRLEEQCHEFRRQLFAPPAETSQTRLRLAMFSGDWARWHLYAPLGINISHPFLDPRVACFALGIPRAVRAAPGDPKPVLRVAMRGWLPDAVRNRREKTGFDGPHARGMAVHCARLEDLVRQSPIHGLGIFDADQLLGAMRRAAVGIGTRHNEWIDRTLALVAWFGQR